MQKCILLFLFLVASITAQSQVVKLSNGIAFSSINSEKREILDDRVKLYSFMLGLDYYDKKYYNLSSEIGFQSKGGREKIITGEFINEKWSYIHMNTTMRIKYPINSVQIYCGVGPFLDVLIDSNQFESELYNNYEMNKLVFGLKPEIGFNQNLSKHMVAGLNCSYCVNLTSAGGSNYDKIKNNVFSLMIVLAYKL